MMFIELYVPVFLSLIFILLSIRLKFSEKVLFRIKTPFLETEHQVTNSLTGRVLLIGSALICLSYYLFVDFSNFFPQHLEMEVFYDQAGLKKSLEVFTPDELTAIGYHTENEQYCSRYYTALDLKLKEILPYNEFFSLKGGQVHSNGETSFKVTKLSGIHSYHILESKGQLLHIVERPQQKEIKFKSFFEKLPSASDYLRPAFSDIVIRRAIILSPRFKQILAEHNRSDGALFDHTLMGITKVYLFPLPKFSNTVNFCEFDDIGSVPISYTVYQ